MAMFIEVFFMLCIIVQPQVCIAPQPLDLEIQRESTTVGNKSSIFSLINYAGNCSAYEKLKLEPEFRRLEEYCERPLPGTPRADGFLSYETVLCMVLYDAVQRVCKVRRQEVTKDIQNFSGDFSCDTMIKGVPEAVDESTKQWVTLFKAKLGSSSDCERECIQNKTISPVCEYIWKTNTLTYQAPVSSTISADTSPTKNPKVNPKGHGKTNKAMTSKVKPLEAKAFDQSSAAGPSLSILNNGSQNTESVDHMVAPTNKSTLHKGVDFDEANGNSTQSVSANDLKKNIKEQAHTKDSNVQNDAKKQANTSDSNTRNGFNKQAEGTNSIVQNMKQQEHAINSSNQSAEVAPQKSPVPLPVHTEHTPEAGKYDGNTGNSISSDSKSNTAPQPDNKSPAGVHASDADAEDQNDDNEFMSTDENADVHDTDVAVNTPSGDDDDQDEERMNSDHEDKQTETLHREEETDNTAQFNQLGDAADSHFYAYFMTMVVICIVGYLVFHNKQKILALALEGRSRRGTRRRPNTSAYRKLDSNLEEAVTSTGSTSVTHVIY